MSLCWVAPSLPLSCFPTSCSISAVIAKHCRNHKRRYGLHWQISTSSTVKSCFGAFTSKPSKRRVYVYTYQLEQHPSVVLSWMAALWSRDITFLLGWVNHSSLQPNSWTADYLWSPLLPNLFLLRSLRCHSLLSNTTADRMAFLGLRVRSPVEYPARSSKFPRSGRIHTQLVSRLYASRSNGRQAGSLYALLNWTSWMFRDKVGSNLRLADPPPFSPFAFDYLCLLIKLRVYMNTC